MSLRQKSVLLAGASLLACSFAARAAEPEAALPEVIVTAQKTSEAASKTPVALSVLSGDDLQNKGVVSILNLSDNTPSVNVSQDGFGFNINIRGVTTTDSTSKGTQGIAFTIDGITIGRPIEEGLAFFDVDRVEVLRGPQGTLYGAASTGGAINILTNKPKDKFEASADFEYGNYDTRRGDLMVNVPVTDTISVRVAGNFNMRDGYVEPSDGSTPRDDQDNNSYRLSARWKANDVTTIDLTYTGGHVGGVGGAEVPTDSLAAGSGSAQRQALGSPYPGKIDDTFSNFNGELNTSFFDYVHATVDGAHMQFHAHEMSSTLNNPAANYGGPPQFFTPEYAWRDYRGAFDTDDIEVRLSNEEKAKLNWVAGFSWMKDTIHESDHNWDNPVSATSLAASLNAIDPVNETDHTNKGAYGQATYNLTEDWRITGGVRWSSDSLQRTGTFAAGPGPWLNAAGGPCVAPENCIGTPNDGSESGSKITYRGETDYQILPNQMIYASIATGYKAGGFNDFNPLTGGTSPYMPESLTAYETGYKGRPLPTLEIDSDAFYYDYSNDQISGTENVAGSVVLFTRIAPAKVYGWENEAHWKITPDDQFDLSVALEHSEFGNFTTGTISNGNVNYTGQSLDKTPTLVVSPGYTHDWTLPNGADLFAHAGTKFSTSYTLTDFSSGGQYRQKAFTRTDLTLGYTTGDGRLSVLVYGRNLEDSVQATGGYLYYPYANGSEAFISEPRTFGVRVGVKY
jgi:iron complex outermembrane receptor protein